MRLSPRALGVVLCLAASGCFGGPTSDWPPRNSDGAKGDGESTNKPPRDLGAGAADAGVRGPNIDAGSPAGAGSVPCVSSPGGDGGTDAGVDDPGTYPDESVSPDAGCR